MKITQKLILAALAVALFLLSASVYGRIHAYLTPASMIDVDDDANLGTWKLNEAKSIFTPGSPKNITVVYESVGDMVKVTVDGVDSAGKPAHNEWTGRFDGKDYAVTGDSSADTRSYTRISSRTLAITNRKRGTVVLRGTIRISADGRSRTVTTKAINSKRQNSAVYDKA